MEKIGTRIRDKRKEKGLSQKELANKIGVDNSQFSKIETGKLYPTLPQLMEICSILNESMDWFVFGKKNEYSNQNYTIELQKEIIDNLKSQLTSLKEEKNYDVHLKNELEILKNIPKHLIKSYEKDNKNE